MPHTYARSDQSAFNKVASNLAFCELSRTPHPGQPLRPFLRFPRTPRRVSITTNQRRFTLTTCLRQVRREARHKLAQAGRPGKHRKKNPKRRRCDTSLARMHSQEPHHKKMSSDAEFLTILKKHNIPLNPKFALA
jgi:hypothetical protein